MDEMNNNSVKKTSFDIDEIDLKEIFKVLWDGKFFIIAVTACFAIFSVYYALSLKDVYKSEAILNVDTDSNPVSSFGGLGGLASIAGINMSSLSGNKSQLALETLRSRAFLKHLIEFEGILPSIMAAESFDKESQKIIFNSDLFDPTENKWVESAENGLLKPTYLQAYETYLSQISIRDEQFITISVEHISPVFAKELLDLMIRETNEILRNKDLRESSDAINFLTSEVNKSSLITMKDAINELVLSRLEMQMMAKVSNEYVLKIIEPPFIPEKKSGPSRALICIVISLIGGIFSVLFVLIRHYNFK